MTKKLISLIVPCFNEGDAITFFVEKMTPILAENPEVSWEIICIDDGSRDDTLKQLRAVIAKDPRFVVVEFSRNFGKEAALTAGLQIARGDAVIPIDVDLQDPPELIAGMLAAWRDGAEVVLARRIDRSTDTMLKRGTASAFYWISNILSQTKIPENVGDFRLMDRAVVEAINELPERQRFMKGLFAWVGFRTVTIDYVRPPRAVGLSKFSGFRLWNFALEGITSFSTMPLKAWTYIGVLGACISLLYSLFIFLRTLIYGSAVPGYASLFVAIVFLGSVQLISIGLLGEYIGRLYIEVKQRPIYIIRKTYTGGASDA